MTRRQTFSSHELDTAALKLLRLEVAAFARAHLGDCPAVHAAEVITAEVLDNLREHAGATSGFTVHAKLQDDELSLTFVDKTLPFNPLATTAPDLEANTIGGLGLHLVKSLAHSQNYERTDAGENVLTVRIRTEQK